MWVFTASKLLGSVELQSFSDCGPQATLHLKMSTTVAGETSGNRRSSPGEGNFPKQPHEKLGLL